MDKLMKAGWGLDEVVGVAPRDEAKGAAVPEEEGGGGGDALPLAVVAGRKGDLHNHNKSSSSPIHKMGYSTMVDVAACEDVPFVRYPFLRLLVASFPLSVD